MEVEYSGLASGLLSFRIFLCRAGMSNTTKFIMTPSDIAKSSRRRVNNERLLIAPSDTEAAVIHVISLISLA